MRGLEQKIDELISPTNAGPFSNVFLLGAFMGLSLDLCCFI
jgi:hypothetical protein